MGDDALEHESEMRKHLFHAGGCKEIRVVPQRYRHSGFAFCDGQGEIELRLVTPDSKGTDVKSR